MTVRLSSQTGGHEIGGQQIDCPEAKSASELARGLLCQSIRSGSRDENLALRSSGRDLLQRRDRLLKREDFCDLHMNVIFN